MLPEVREVEGVEMIRDGGSLAATFFDAEDARFILVFWVRFEDPEDFQIGRVRYDPPVLIDCDPAKRPVDTDTVKHSELGGPAVSMSWADARQMLAVIGDLLERQQPQARLHEFYAQRLAEMMEVAEREGQASWRSGTRSEA